MAHSASTGRRRRISGRCSRGSPRRVLGVAGEAVSRTSGAVDVNYEKQSALKLIDAMDHFAQRCRKSVRRRLQLPALDVAHITDVIDQQTDRLAADLNND